MHTKDLQAVLENKLGFLYPSCLEKSLWRIYEAMIFFSVYKNLCVFTPKRTVPPQRTEIL